MFNVFVEVLGGEKNGQELKAVDFFLISSSLPHSIIEKHKVLQEHSIFIVTVCGFQSTAS